MMALVPGHDRCIFIIKDVYTTVTLVVVFFFSVERSKPAII